jgi:NAD-dependent dihydropyrimidine dehydrogenase PreA subunit
MVDKWYKAARSIIRAGNMPFPANNPTLFKLLKLLITEEQAEFIASVFRRPNLNMEQIKKRTDLDEEAINKMLNNLMDGGIITGTESRSSGIMVYRLMPPYPGLFEFTLMRGNKEEKDYKVAALFERLFDEISDITQTNYENVVPQYKNFPPIDRIVPVEEEIGDIAGETVIPFEEVTKIIEKYDDIALAHCYCRHQKDLLGDPCKATDKRENCLLFGKSAKFAIDHGFGKAVSKKEVKKVVLSAEDDGLVHKVFHIQLNIDKEEEALCNCCKCCCGIFRLFYKGVLPYHCYSSYIAYINDENCIGCGTCVQMCPMETIELEDTIAVLNEDKCIGCGICVHNCPEEAIILKRTGTREVFVPPPRLS